jgi:hypothetical protein
MSCRRRETSTELGVADEFGCCCLVVYEKGNERPNSLICIESLMTVSFSDSFVFPCLCSGG